jgi:hypothetical protein
LEDFTNKHPILANYNSENDLPKSILQLPFQSHLLPSKRNERPGPTPPNHTHANLGQRSGFMTWPSWDPTSIAVQNIHDVQQKQANIVHGLAGHGDKDQHPSSFIKQDFNASVYALRKPGQWVPP